jgi:hypothetical protein
VQYKHAACIAAAKVGQPLALPHHAMVKMEVTSTLHDKTQVPMLSTPRQDSSQAHKQHGILVLTRHHARVVLHSSTYLAWSYQLGTWVNM